MSAWLYSRLRRVLDELERKGRRRTLSPPSGHDFSSNDVLGASAVHPEIAATASRLLRGHRREWDAVEAALAAWHGVEATTLFNTGYAANLGVLSALLMEGDYVLSDALNHASIIDGLRSTRAERFIYRHGDVGHLREGLARANGRPTFIVTESLFGMDGDIPDLKAIAACDAALIVDEAHATGVFGPRGSGLVDALGVRDRVVASVHTGGKALGVPGAYVAGTKLLHDFLVNTSRNLIFTTALPPIAATWWAEALSSTQANEAGRARVQALSDHLRAALSARDVPHLGEAYIVLIPVGEDHKAVALAQRLQASGFDVRAIRPPTVPEGSARLRISIHANHDEALLDALAVALAAAWRQL
jgi:8-amino-7-oxononanoate synthase